MSSGWKWVAIALALAAGAAYLGFNYFVAASERPPALAVLVGLLPMVALLVAQAAQARFKVIALAACLLLAAAAVWCVDELRSHVALLYLVQHVGAMALLGLTFGITLWSGHAKALCSQIAAFMSAEPLNAAYQRYTWQVTWAWTLFFVLSALLSLGLYRWAPVTWWSFFANVLTPVLTGAMFVVEYLVRIRLMPDRPHMSIAHTITAYQRFKQDSK